MKLSTDPISLTACPIEAWPEFGSLLRALADEEGLLALDSAGGEPGDWSWIAWQPVEVPGGLPSSLEGLRDYVNRAPQLDGEDLPGPFHGGFMGALAYDPGVPGEGQQLPQDPWNQPAIVGGWYTTFFVFDHKERQAWLVAPERLSAGHREAWIQLALNSTSKEEQSSEFQALGPLTRHTSSTLHQQRIEKVRAEIAEGEYFQTNLAHAFEVETEGDPVDLYLRLRRINPAPYMAFIPFDQGALLSASPELLVQIENSEMLARPIKGTAQRHSERLEDERLAQELLKSEKDRAELAMIVDLLRNDLGRVARIGSVHVEGFPALRSYAGVHHLMANVRAQLAEGKDSIDALCSVFPGGSITGAPKLRAMQAIAEHEGQGRGFFTGAAGYLDYRGDACFNILIRTMQWRAEPAAGPSRGRIRFHVGGGITWSSEAQAEDLETLVKGAYLARTLGHELLSDKLPI